MAVTLGRVHGLDAAMRSAPFLADLGDLVHDVERWVRPAVTAVVAEYAGLPPLTWGAIHGDPAPEAFVHDRESASLGLIDWTAGSYGPVLYDVASTVMYLGGEERARAFLAAYVKVTPAPAAEINHHLRAFRRFRAGVQAAYFSMRVATADPTGIADQQENWKGLEDARHLLTELGVMERQPLRRTEPR